MSRKSIETRFFKIRPGKGEEQAALDAFYLLKKGKDVSEIEKATSGDFVREHLGSFQKKGLLRSGGAKGRNVLSFNPGYRKVVGVGFRADQCFLTVMDLSGNITDKEKIQTDLLLKVRGKNKDVSGIVKMIGEKTKLKGEKYACCGVAIPEDMIDVNPKTVNIMEKGFKSIFRTNIFVSKSATASAYGDREMAKEAGENDILYMYSDVGIGIILKKEAIFEADEYEKSPNSAYLRPWNQFSIVKTTKDLVARGVGSDVVKIVKGDVDRITLDIVLEAAERKDELAEDLIKKSGLALGVRVAYLVNMFNIDVVVFGGGIEREETFFTESVKESMKKFLSSNIADRLKIIPGVLGKESSSIGAALLCRRELFMEV